jgi:hypothetical protein
MRNRIAKVMTPVVAAAWLLGGALVAQAGEVGEIKADEYYAAAYYKQALEDERIQKIKSPDKQLKKIASSIGMSPKKVQAAVEKVEGLGGDPAALATAAIKKGLEGTRVKGRVMDVLINASEPKHVIAYIRFRGEKAANVVKDASAIAQIVASKTPLVTTLSLSAIHPKAADDSKVSVWSAKIATSRAQNIDPARIEVYADRMYGRLFEIVDSKPF